MRLAPWNEAVAKTEKGACFSCRTNHGFLQVCSGKLDFGSREDHAIPPGDLCLSKAQDQMAARGMGKAIIGRGTVREHDSAHELADVFVKLREILGMALRGIFKEPG